MRNVTTFFFHITILIVRFLISPFYKKPLLPGTLTYRPSCAPSSGPALTLVMEDGIVLELRISLWRTLLSFLEMEETCSIQFINGLWSFIWGVGFMILGHTMYTLSPVFYHWMIFWPPQAWGFIWAVKGFWQVYSVLLLYRSKCLYFESSACPFRVRAERSCYLVAQASLWYSFFIACGFIQSLHCLNLISCYYLFWVIVDMWCLRSLVRK